ncbi:DUF1294 domain-containing protein [Pseudoduganella lutea]|uniref:DUF1294 domain-containing protein n=1 Tax=Pseudoduganella lutea TaxID=321985 RepID=UPI0027D948D5|nr:DUF1294 domain-containing protein [Pseudoduganella lutea]
MCASLATFLAYFLDKRAARAGRRRTPERTLLLFGLAGGWPGAFSRSGSCGTSPRKLRSSGSSRSP